VGLFILKRKSVSPSGRQFGKEMMKGIDRQGALTRPVDNAIESEPEDSPAWRKVTEPL
jgi:hypothetical protein